MHDALPDFLNRKLNPHSPPTAEERREYAARTPVQEQVEQRYSTIAPEDEAVLEAIEQEKKAATDRRIAKMKAKKAAKDQTKGIPDEFLCWDAKYLRFYDLRVRNARKLAAARKKMGLEA
jgi:arginine utilization protein RocB